MAAKVDWEKWRKIYVAGDDDLTLAALSRHQSAPSLDGLKKVSIREGWVEQRKQFRHQIDNKVLKSATTQRVVDHVERLIDVAEIQARHINLAKDMQELIASSLKDMRESDVKLSPRDAATWLKVATELERLAVGLVTHRTEVVNTDVTELSDEELQAIVSKEQ